MKLDDKQKKWMIIGGAVIVCMILVILIAGQFKSEPATAVQDHAGRPDYCCRTYDRE